MGALLRVSPGNRVNSYYPKLLRFAQQLLSAGYAERWAPTRTYGANISAYKKAEFPSFGASLLAERRKSYDH
jgi:hypothetical protein